MLAKCANPACSAKFQYLHLGKLFAIEYRNSARYALAGGSEFVQKSDRLRYFWLCPACSRTMTIQISGTERVRIALAPSACDPNQYQPKEAIRETGLPISNATRHWGCKMLTTQYKLDALVKELQFLEDGGYRQPMGWRPALIFEDSPICPKPPFSACPNAQCVLLDFVPEEQRNQIIPCQHIPLNDVGETLHTMYRTMTVDEIEKVLKEWLRNKIAEIRQADRSGVMECDEHAA